MPRIMQGRLGLALWGVLFLGLIVVAIIFWIQLGRIGEDVGGADVESSRRLLIYASIAAGILIVLLLVVTRQRLAAPLRRLARELRR